jgi:hypothetical protein
VLSENVEKVFATGMNHDNHQKALFFRFSYLEHNESEEGLACRSSWSCPGSPLVPPDDPGKVSGHLRDLR